MSNGRFLLSAILAAALCFFGGLAIAKLSKPAAPISGGESSAANSPTAGTKPLTALPSRSGGRKSAARQFAALTGSPDHGLYQRMSGFFRLISEAEPDEMPALIETMLREMPEDLGGELMVVAAAARWVEKDQQGALAAALDGRPRALREALEVILKTSARQDPRGAWQQLLEADAKGGGRLANQKTRDRVIHSLLSNIGEDDIDLAIELCLSAENPNAYSAGLDGALRDFAARKPLEFLDRWEEMPFQSSSSRQDAVRRAFQSIDPQGEDLAQALGRLEKLDGSMRRNAATALAHSWAQVDPTSALEWADGLGLETQQHAKAIILGKLGDQDPVAAAEALLEQSNPMMRSRAASQIARAWVQKDREAALEWVREELEGKAQQNSYTSLLEESIRRADFEKDIEILKEMADGDPGSSNAHHQFARKWARSDPQAAAEWAVGKSKPAFSVVAQQWARSDPETFRRFAASLEDEAMIEVAQHQLDLLEPKEDKP